MSGTLTKDQVKTLHEKLGFKSSKLISITPDRPNIFLEKKMKVKSNDVMFVYEDVFQQECLDLKSNPENYPVTIMYIPMFYMSCAIMFLKSLFGKQQITHSCYSTVYANHDDDVMTATLADLNSDSPKIRLVLSTSVSGMGFDPPPISNPCCACLSTLFTFPILARDAIHFYIWSLIHVERTERNSWSIGTNVTEDTLEND